MNSFKPMVWVFVLLAALLAGCGGQQSEGSAANAPTSTGSELFERLGCVACHQMSGGGPGPSLAGSYGETIQLEGGESVLVDDEYIRTSILEPNAQIHAGYQPIMPSYEGRLDEDGLSALVEYIRSLGK